MNDRDTLFLNHPLSAIADISNFTTDRRGAFISDRKTQCAVIRQLEVIGEAVKKLSVALTDSEAAVPRRQIAGTRDRFIHACFSVGLDAVWSMIEQDLPALRGKVRQLLERGLKPGP